MSTTPNGAPLADFPQVTIGGVLYQIRFGLGSMYRLEEYGINAGDLGNAIREFRASGKNIQLVMKLACAGLGLPTRSGKWKPIDATPEQLAFEMTREELEGLSEKLLTAWGKVPRPEVTPTKVAEMTPGPSPTT